MRDETTATRIIGGNARVRKGSGRVSAVALHCLIPHPSRSHPFFLPSSLIPMFLIVSSLMSHPSSLAHAFTSLGAFRHGDEIRGVSARSLAMGGACIAACNEPTALLVNPALISQVDGTLAISVSPGVTAAFYRRNHNDKTYASDSNTYFGVESLALSLRHPRMKFVTIAGGYNTVSNLDFTLEETGTRDRNDPQKSGSTPGIDRSKMSGGIAQWSMGMSFRPVRWLMFGGSYIKIASRSKMEETLITLKTGASAITQNTEQLNRYLADTFQAGLAVAFSPALAFGVNFQPQSKMAINTQSTSVQEGTVKSIARQQSQFILPARWGAGILYGIKGSDKNLVTVDVSLTQWEQSRNTVQLINDATAHVHTDPGYGSVLEFHVGYEYIYKDKFPIRLGFYHLPDYVRSPSSATTFFTVGTGYKWKRFSVDVAGEYGNRTTSQTRLFYTDQRDSVTDSRFRSLVTVTYLWK